ncbi:MAG TPA: hypothetical protein VE987_03085 [Polyangiaceae bacterium]|nr:hypothetical protein [Polyangiaceae bacterium]
MDRLCVDGSARVSHGDDAQAQGLSSEVVAIGAILPLEELVYNFGVGYAEHQTNDRGVVVGGGDYDSSFHDWISFRAGASPAQEATCIRRYVNSVVLLDVAARPCR